MHVMAHGMQGRVDLRQQRVCASRRKGAGSRWFRREHHPLVPGNKQGLHVHISSYRPSSVYCLFCLAPALLPSLLVRCAATAALADTVATISADPPPILPSSWPFALPAPTVGAAINKLHWRSTCNQMRKVLIFTLVLPPDGVSTRSAFRHSLPLFFPIFAGSVQRPWCAVRRTYARTVLP